MVEKNFLDLGLYFGKYKTKILVFKKPRVDSFTNVSVTSTLCSNLKILGVTFNDTLNWNAHVDSITKTASRRVHILRLLKNIPSVTKKDLMLVYEGYILSVIEYNAPLFTHLSKKNSERLERIRKRCHHIICGFHCDCDDFPPLSSRRVAQAMKLFSLMQNPKHFIHNLIPHLLPRSNHFFLDHMRTERRRLSFVPFCCMQWNMYAHSHK